jgi:hypothetical protein
VTPEGDQMDDVPGWTDSTRDDGMVVAIAFAGTWYVKPPDDRPSITTCPCCGTTFPTARTAKMAANALYPVGPAGR